MGWVEWSPSRQSAVLRKGLLRAQTSRQQVRRKVTIPGVVDQLEMASSSSSFGAAVVASWLNLTSGGRSVGVFDSRSLECLWTQTLQAGEKDVAAKVLGGGFVPHMRVDGLNFSRTTCGGGPPIVFTLVQLTGFLSGAPARLDVTSFALKRILSSAGSFVCTPIGALSVPCDNLEKTRSEDAHHWHTRAVLTAHIGNHSIAILTPRNRIVVAGWTDNSGDLRSASSSSSSLVAALSWQCEYSGLDDATLVVDLAAASPNLLLVSAAQVGVHVLRVAREASEDKVSYSIQALFLHSDSSSLLVRLRAFCFATSEDGEKGECEVRVVAADRYKQDQGVLLTVWLVGRSSSGRGSFPSSSMVPLLLADDPLDYSMQSVSAVVCGDTLHAESGVNKSGGDVVLSDFVFLDNHGQVVEGICTSTTSTTTTTITS